MSWARVMEKSIQCFAPNVSAVLHILPSKLFPARCQHVHYIAKQHENKQTKNHNWDCCMCSINLLRSNWYSIRSASEFLGCCCANIVRMPKYVYMYTAEHASKMGPNQFFMQSRFGLNLASVFHSLVSDFAEHFLFVLPFANFFFHFVFFAPSISFRLTASVCDLFLCQLTHIHSLTHSLSLLLLLSLYYFIFWLSSVVISCRRTENYHDDLFIQVNSEISTIYLI